MTRDAADQAARFLLRTKLGGIDLQKIDSGGQSSATSLCTHNPCPLTCAQLADLSVAMQWYNCAVPSGISAGNADLPVQWFNSTSQISEVSAGNDKLIRRSLTCDAAVVNNRFNIVRGLITHHYHNTPFPSVYNALCYGTNAAGTDLIELLGFHIAPTDLTHKVINMFRISTDQTIELPTGWRITGDQIAHIRNLSLIQFTIGNGEGPLDKLACNFNTPVSRANYKKAEGIISRILQNNNEDPCSPQEWRFLPIDILASLHYFYHKVSPAKQVLQAELKTVRITAQSDIDIGTVGGAVLGTLVVVFSRGARRVRLLAATGIAATMFIRKGSAPRKSANEMLTQCADLHWQPETDITGDHLEPFEQRFNQE